jgi:hypothetical protein
MDGALVAEAGIAGHVKTRDVAVAVITPAGIYPDDDDFRREAESTLVAVVLEQAAKALKLTNTADWVAHADGRPVDARRSFAENGLHGIVEIEWHKHEGGGGA